MNLINKLFTKEDEFNIHKTLGLISLINFIYRYFYLLPFYGNLGLGENLFINNILVIIHFLLSFSSLLFHVVKNRFKTRPLIIYKEYQLHAIVFTLRSCLIYFAAIIGKNLSIICPLIILVCHLIVDLITYYYGKEGVTAVRAKGKDNNLYRNISRYYYSYYQIVAIGSHLLENNRLADMGFNTLIAIQSSAFLMTLSRKNIIHWKTYMLIYSFCLLLSYLVIIKFHSYNFLLGCILVFLSRICGVSKYIGWSIFVICNNFYF
jgi:hypothetical protein